MHPGAFIMMPRNFFLAFILALSCTAVYAAEPDWPDWLAAQRRLPADQALQHLYDAEATFGHLSEYQYWLGVYLLETAAPLAQALERFERALMLDPNNAGAMYDYGLVMCKMGDRASCANILQHAQAQFGTPPKLLATDHVAEKLVAYGEVRTGLGYSTNYNRGPRSNSLDINFFGIASNLPLAENDRAQAGFFTELATNATLTHISFPQLSLTLNALRREPRAQLANFTAIAGELNWQYIPNQRISFLYYRLDDAMQGRLDAHAIYLAQQLASYGYWSVGIEHRQARNYSGYVTFRAESVYPLLPAIDVLARIERDFGQVGRPELQQTRATLGINLKTLLLDQAKLDFGWRSQYAQDNNVYSSVFGERVRHFWQNEFGIRLSWPINKTLEMRSELRHFRQTSNLQLFIQRETQFTVGVAGRF